MQEYRVKIRSCNDRSQQARITIPAKMRTELCLRSGDRLRVGTKGEQIAIVKSKNNLGFQLGDNGVILLPSNFCDKFRINLGEKVNLKAINNVIYIELNKEREEVYA